MSKNGQTLEQFIVGSFSSEGDSLTRQQIISAVHGWNRTIPILNIDKALDTLSPGHNGNLEKKGNSKKGFSYTLKKRLSS